VLLGDFDKRIEPGETLSQIAKEHYGSAAHDLVAALARYNGLADADELVVGAVLRLPPLDRLGEPGSAAR
jgi:nucleoid-associated protein YgaU